MKRGFKNIVKFGIYSLFLIVVIFIFFRLSDNESYALDNSTNYLGDYVLNPEWIEYMELSDEDKNYMEIIPEKFIYRYKNFDTGIKLFSFRNNYPNYYNLNDYGQSTFPDHQRSLGICWAFAGVSSVETYMLKVGLSNISNPIKFSVRQLDYAGVSSNYISEGYNPYAIATRTYPGSGAFSNSAFVLMASGISPVSTDVYGYFDESRDVKSLKEVINLDNVEYVVDSYINYGSLDEYSTDSERKAWVNEIKNHVMNYGSVALTTISPLAGHAGSCSFKDSSNNYLLNVRGECNPLDTDNRHAMAIIGWDDNYEYKYCRLNGETSNDLTNCDNIVSGKGAFILKNSWADTYPYPYFSYDSNVIGAYGVTGVTEKTWDTNYDYSKISDSNYEYQISNITYYKSSKIEERLEKISFYSNSRKDINYDIYVSSDGNGNYVKVDSVTTNNIGLNSIYVDDILLKGDKFSIKITSDDGYVDQIYAFTSYVDSSDDIVLDTVVRTGMEYSSNIEDFSLYTVTKNIEAGSKIEYKFIDNSGNDISNLVTIKNSYVVNNFVKTKVIINGEFPVGKVVLKTIYNGGLYDSLTLNIVKLKNLWAGGSGSIDDPFLIDRASDFEKIFTNDEYMKAHYKLISDLDFSDIEGWNSGDKSNYQAFSGSLDGDNHKILGLNSDSILPALFYKVEGAEFKNLVFSNIDFNMVESSFGNLLAVLAYDSSFTNIIIDDTVNISGNASYAGGIVASAYNSSFTNIFNYGNVFSGYYYHGKAAGIVVEGYGIAINECYNYGDIIGTNSIVGGIVSYLGNDSNSGNVGTLKNSYNIGNVSSEIYAGGIVGEGENTYIDGVYNISNSDDIGNNFYNIVGSASGMVVMNSYYLDNSRGAILNNYNSELVNVMAKSSEQMKEKSTYLNFDFDNVWEIDSSYPYFKDVYYYYLDDIEVLNNIVLNLGETKNIEIKYIPNKVINNKLRFEFDNNIVDIKDNVVTAIGSGNTILKVYTTDGSNIVKKINITFIYIKINLDDYEIIDKKYIKINSIINKNNFVNNIKTNDYYDIKITGSEENVATGNKLEIYNKEGILDSEYIIVVLGDITGTGNINVSDVAKLYQYIKGTIDMEKEFILASDVVLDNELKVNDVAKLYQYIKKSIESLEG